VLKLVIAVLQSTFCNASIMLVVVVLADINIDLKNNFFLLFELNTFNTMSHGFVVG